MLFGSWIRRIRRYAVGATTLLIVAAASQNTAMAKDLAAANPLQAIEIYTFVLPAIDCYRTTEVKFTTNQKALKDILSTAFDSLPDHQMGRTKDAAVRGAAQYEKMVAQVGKQGFCTTVVRRYGPKGTVFRGLMIEKRGA